MRLFTKLWTTLLLLCVAGVVNAAKEYEIDQKFTGLADLVTSGQLFSIVNETDAKGLCFGFGDAEQNMYYETYADMASSKSYTFKLENAVGDDVAGYYYLRPYKPDGTLNNVWGWGGYFNSQPADGWCDFCLGLDNKNGQDLKNGAVWAIEASDGKFALKNVGTGKYLKDAAPAKYDAATYFTFCTLKEKVSTDPLAEQKDALEAAIAKGKMYNAIAYTEATFAAVGTAVSAGETALAAADATAESLTAATKAITDAIAALALKDGYSDLTAANFFEWDSATAPTTSKATGCDFSLFTATGMVYGNSSVALLTFADLSAYDKLVVAAASGTPRILLNRDVNEGQWSETEAESHLIDNTKGGWSAKYFTTENGVTTVDLKQLVADKGFAHLHSIKGSGNVTVSGLYLYKEAVAGDVLPIDIQFGADYNSNKVQDYVSTWTATKNGKTWTIVNFNNNNNGWNSIKCGRKNTASVASIASPAIDAAVKYYVITLAAASNVNSAKLTLMNGEDKVGEDIDITEKFVAGEVTVPVEGQKGYSYVLTIDNASASKNGSVEITKITLAAEVKEPVHIANTAETAYTVAKAVELINAGDALDETVFVKGIVSKVDGFNDTYKSITYWISEDGKTEGQQFECYGGKGIAGADFASVDDVKVGATVIVKGTMTKYGEVYEFTKNNELVSYVAPVDPNNFTAKIVNADLTGNDGWDTTGTKGYHSVGGVVTAGNNAQFDFKQTIANLPAGKYKVTAQAAYRYSGGEDTEAAAIAAGTETKFAKLYATVGKKSAEALVQNRYDGISETNLLGSADGVSVVNEKYVPNSTAAVKAWFTAGKYVNELEFNVPADGDVTIGIVKTAQPEAGDYTVIGPWTLTRIGDADPEPQPSWVAPTIAGEDPVNGGQYKVMNVGSGKYLAMGKAWFSWATTAIVAEDGFVATFTGDASSFTLTNNDNKKFVFTSGNDIQGDAMHADGGNATNYGLTQLPNGNYRIHDAGGNAESKCWGYNSDFHATGIVAHADATAAGWNCEWIFVGDNAANLFNAKTALYNALLYAAENDVDTDEASAVYAKADATVDELKAAADKLTHETNFAVNTANAVEGADMTYTIVNPSFETGTTKGWTYEASNDHGAKENSNGTYTMTNCDGKYLFNIWSSGNAISQVVEDLPNGTYKLSAVIATDNGQKVQINANDKNIQVDAVDKGTGVKGEVEFTVLDNKATIGAEGVNKYWYKVDDFRLTFVKGFDLTGLVAAYEEALAAAQAVTGKMNADVKKALDAAIAAEVDKTKVEALTAATSALNEATAAAKASVEAYTKAGNVLPKMKELTESTNVYTEAAYTEYYGQWVSKFDAKTLTTDEANALQDPFLTTGWHAAITCDNFLLSAWDTNPDFQDAPYYINTWSTEGNNDGSDFKVPFFEYWTSDGNSLGEKTLTATMNNQEAGEYDVTALVRVRIKNGVEAPAFGITMQANEGEAVNVVGDQVGTSQMYLKEVKAVGTVGEDGVLKIKFIVAADNNISWLSFKNVMFTKKAIEVAHTWNFTKWSEATVANLKAEAAKVTVSADPDKEGNTMCVDNDAIWTDHEKKPGTTCDTYNASKDNCFWYIGGEAEPTANGEAIAEFKGLQFDATYGASRALAIAVNYPSTTLGTYNGPAYLWFGGKNQTILTIKNVKPGTLIKMGVESHKSSDARGVQLLIGETVLKDADGNDVAAPKEYTEQTWQVPAGESAVDVIVKNTNGCHIYYIDAEIDTTATAITAVKNNNLLNGTIYNLNGQKMEKAQKGLYIINGKKVVVK